jgi:hypothetical protein
MKNKQPIEAKRINTLLLCSVMTVAKKKELFAYDNIEFKLGNWK